MSTGEPEAKRDELRPRERRRLKLIESYGAFSDDRLQEVAQKIRGITSDPDTQPRARQGDAPCSGGDITQSITPSMTQWLTQCPSGETEAVKEKQGFENTELTGANPQIFTPVASPDRSPSESPSESPDTPDGSPNGSPGRSPHGSSNRSPDGSSIRSPNESLLQLQLLPPSSADAGV